MSRRGAELLLERQAQFWGWDPRFIDFDDDADGIETAAELDAMAGGLFIADVDGHEPFVYTDGFLGCRCGWREMREPGPRSESYFDHIEAAS